MYKTASQSLFMVDNMTFLSYFSILLSQNPKKSQCAEHGSLEKRKIADMVILNQDPLKLELKELRSLNVEKLFLNGKEYETGMGLMGMLWNSLGPQMK